MPLLTYSRDIPDGPNNPSFDQPNMKINTNSIDDLINVDHYGFNDNNGGWHKQVTMPILAVAPTTTPGQVALYSGMGAVASELAMIRDGNVGTAVALTTSKIGAPTAATNGVSWLPGGILTEWGSTGVIGTAQNTDIPVNFTVAFPNNCFNVQLTAVAITNVDAGSFEIGIRGIPSTTGFIIRADFTLTGIPPIQYLIYWRAEGN